MGKKKVLIITIWDNENIGNRLQNYALQQVLKNLGFEVYSGVVEKHHIEKSFERKRKIKVFLARLGVEKYYHELDKVTRKKEGRKFNKKYIPNREYIRSFDDAFKKDFSKYDYIIAGSDQIWHWWYQGSIYHEPNELKYYGLKFVPKTKRIAYAGSFGFNAVPENMIREYIDVLNGYRTLSVREDTGADIVKSLIGLNVPVVLDPTFLVDADQWATIEKKPSFVKKSKYVLIYALGEKDKMLKKANETAENEYRCTVVDVRAKGKNGRELPVGPSEFIYLVHHAEAVFTDSFHGTVFSILFHKNCTVFQRNGVDMSGRIRSLARTLGINEVRNGNSEVILTVNKNEDYSIIERKLKMEQDKSLEYLKYALKIGGGV